MERYPKSDNIQKVFNNIIILTLERIFYNNKNSKYRNYFLPQWEKLTTLNF